MRLSVPVFLYHDTDQRRGDPTRVAFSRRKARLGNQMWTPVAQPEDRFYAHNGGIQV